MKKILVLCLLLTCILTVTYGQLKVANNFGQDLNVTVDGLKNLIPNMGIKVYPSVRSRTVWLICESTSGAKKFTIEKQVSRSGKVTIESGDFSSAAESTTTKTTVYPVSPATQSTSYTVSSTSYSSSSPISEILGGKKPATNYSQAPSTETRTVVSSAPISYAASSAPVTAPIYVSAPKKAYDRLAFVYEGIDRFKIFSEIGRGLEFLGADTANAQKDNAKNKYYISVPKDQDLIIGLGIKESGDPAIWPYAEIRKRVNSWDTVCFVTQKDIKKMSTSERRRVKIRPVAAGYKIFFEPGSEAGNEAKNQTPISLGYRDISRIIEVPIGQFYIRMSFTDIQGIFHRTVFVPKHVTVSDKYLEITKKDLDNAVQLNW